MGIGPLHDLMLVDHLRGLLAGLRHHGIRLALCVLKHLIRLGTRLSQDSVLLADNLLVLFDLVRYPQTQLH